MSIANMKVGTKLGLGFAAMIVMLIAVAAIGIANMHNIQTELNDVVNDKYPKTVWANNIVGGVNTIARAMRNMLLESDPGRIQKDMDRVIGQRAIIKENLAKLEDKIRSSEGKAILGQVKESRAKYVEQQDKFLKMVKEGKQSEAKTFLFSEMREIQAVYLENIEKLIEFQNEQMKKTGDEAHTAAQSALTLIIVLALIAIIVGIVIAIMIVRGLMKQLGGEPDYAAHAVGKIAGGDLSAELAIKPGDTTSLVYSLKTMQDSLRSIVGEIRNIVAAANKGDFNTKMDMSGKAGYTKELSELLNQLSNTVDGAFKDTIRVADALAHGDLSQKVTAEYQGAYNQVKVSVNTTADSLTQIVAEIQGIVEAANKGDFSTKLDMSGKQGYTKTLSELLNQLSDTVDTAFKDTIHVAQALAQGDLTQMVTRDYQGAFNDVKQNLNDTVGNLKNLVNEVKVSVDSIGTASKEIASGNTDLSQRTEEQASSLEETAASMEELTSTV
ncbi:MAG: chemotaxis protein, partial [Gallionellaceae bacterium]